jgi:hypothetical protein
LIILKLYATLVALSMLTGLGHLLVGMMTDDLRIAERGLGFFVGGLAGVLAAVLGMALSLLWAS